jgi:hypothetical protein
MGLNLTKIKAMEVVVVVVVEALVAESVEVVAALVCLNLRVLSMRYQAIKLNKF